MVMVVDVFVIDIGDERVGGVLFHKLLVPLPERLTPNVSSVPAPIVVVMVVCVLIGSGVILLEIDQRPFRLLGAGIVADGFPVSAQVMASSVTAAFPIPWYNRKLQLISRKLSLNSFAAHQYWLARIGD